MAVSIDKARVISSFFIGIAVVVAAVVLAASWNKTHVSHQTVTVTGHGQKDFQSDLIVWRATFSRQAPTLADANRLIRSDIGEVKHFFATHGIPEQEVAFASLKVRREYATVYNSQGNITGNEFKGFVLVQDVTVQSRDLMRVEEMTGSVGDIIEKGIEFSAQSPDYFFTKLQDLKIELLKQATADGLERAATIAGNAGSNVGNLRNAGMGVFQITGQNSNEDYSWGGSFNTKSKDKTASITVRLEFEL